jgi:hypothetical protein
MGGLRVDEHQCTARAWSEERAREKKRAHAARLARALRPPPHPRRRKASRARKKYRPRPRMFARLGEPETPEWPVGVLLNN